MVRIASFLAIASAALGVWATPIVDSRAPAVDVEERYIDLGLNLVKSIEVFLTLDSITTNEVSVTVTLSNPLLLPLEIKSLKSDSGLDGQVYAHFDYEFPFKSFIIPAQGTAVSPRIPHVNLTQGAEKALEIIPRGILDVNSVLTGALSIIPIPWLPYSQNSVPTTYTLEI